MIEKFRGAAAGLAILLLSTPSIAADNDAELRASLKSCADIENVLNRLACYDELVAAMDAAGKADDAAGNSNAPSVVPGNSAAVAAANFGLTETEVAEKEGRDAVEAITAEIVEINSKPRGERVIRLDNGMIWEESRHLSNVRLEPGDTVTIEKGAFGSFMLKGPHTNRSLRVDRIE